MLLDMKPDMALGMLMCISSGVHLGSSVGMYSPWRESGVNLSALMGVSQHQLRVQL